MLRARYTPPYTRADTVKSASQIFDSHNLPIQKTHQETLMDPSSQRQKGKFQGKPETWVEQSSFGLVDLLCKFPNWYSNPFHPAQILEDVWKSQKMFQKEFFTHIVMVILGSFLKHAQLSDILHHVWCLAPVAELVVAIYEGLFSKHAGHMKNQFHIALIFWRVKQSNLESSKLTRICTSPVFLMMPSSVCITQLLNSVTAPPNPPAFVASSHLFAWICWKECNSKSTPTTRKNAPGPRVNAAWFFWPDHISRWSTKIISKFSLKSMQKTSFNKKIQKNPGDCITNISQHLLPPTSPTIFSPPDAPGLRHLDQKVALPRSSAITRHQGPTPVASGCSKLLWNYLIMSVYPTWSLCKNGYHDPYRHGSSCAIYSAILEFLPKEPASFAPLAPFKGEMRDWASNIFAKKYGDDVAQTWDLFRSKGKFLKTEKKQICWD